MANAALIQSKVEFGYGKAASVLGQSCALYRPAGVPLTPPLSAASIGSLMVAMDQDAQFGFTRPDQFAKYQWYGLFDATTVHVGDYLVHPSLGTFFVDSLNPLQSHGVVRCERVMTFSRPGDPATGASYYGGDVTQNETVLMTQWPASVLQGSKGEVGATKLPGDVRMPWVQILLPATSGVQLRVGDIAMDTQAISQRYALSSVEISPHGYRLTAIQLAT